MEVLIETFLSIASVEIHRPIYTAVHVHAYREFEFHPRQFIFLRKSDCLGCAVFLCLAVCLTLLDSFFLPSLVSH